MIRFKGVLVVVVAATMASTTAEAGGYRRGGPSMTPYGPVYNYTDSKEYKLWASNPAAYEQLMVQRQMQYEAQQQQQYVKMQQAYIKQMQKDPNFRAQMQAAQANPIQATRRRAKHKKHPVAANHAPKDAQAKATSEAKDVKPADAKSEPAKAATTPQPEASKTATTP